MALKVTAEQQDGLSLIAEQARAATIPQLTSAVHKALDLRFPAPEWLTAREVICGTRQIDAVIVRMWADAVIHAVEVKASRSDWLREMANPNKADVALPFVDYFYLAVADASVAKIEEVPAHWGLLVLQKNGQLRAAKAAPMLKPHVEGRKFWASLMRRAWQGSEDREFERRISDASNAGYERGVEWGAKTEREKVRRDAEELQQSQRLREAFGWDTAHLIARAPEIKAWLNVERQDYRVANLVDSLRKMATELETVMRSPGAAT